MNHADKIIDLIKHGNESIMEAGELLQTLSNEELSQKVLSRIQLQWGGYGPSIYIDGDICDVMPGIDFWIALLESNLLSGSGVTKLELYQISTEELQRILPHHLDLEFLSVCSFWSRTKTVVLHSIPDNIRLCTKLRVLRLEGHGDLTRLNPCLGELKELRSLNLSSTGIQALHPCLLSLPFLQSLILRKTDALRVIPKSIAQKESLRLIDMSVQQYKVHRFAMMLPNDAASLNKIYLGYGGITRLAKERIRLRRFMEHKRRQS